MKKILKLILAIAIKAIITFILLIAVSALAMWMPIVGIIAGVFILLISCFAIFKPLPKIKLSSKLFSAVLAVVVGLMGTSFAVAEYQSLELKNSNPEKYLSSVKSKGNDELYFAALKSAHPETAEEEIAKFKENMEKAQIKEEEQAAELNIQIAKKNAKLAAEYRASLGDFPDGKTKEKANKLGIERYGAFKLLKDLTVIQNYCRYEILAYAVEDEKHRQMDLQTSEEAIQTIDAAAEVKQQKLAEQFNIDNGLIEYERYTLSSKGYWDWHCRAQERGWQVIDEDAALSVSEDDVDLAVRGIQAFYMFELENNTSFFFNSDKYSVANCKWKPFKSFKIVGCQLKSLSWVSKWNMFLIGKQKDGTLAASAVNGDTGANIVNSGKSPELNARAAARTYLEAYAEPRVYMANFAYEPLPVAEIRDLFSN